ncbi:hypothetical protein ABOZ73_07465 [Caulobacter sp. 73W]|uniref:Lipoprotein n=1 Tax=Caulobacter sp. 73W TaxID=3161137 RepID=A0AB39KWB5_9CAUL
MILRLPAVATIAALSVAACSEKTPPATPESQSDAASASAPAGTARQVTPDGAPATAADTAMQQPTSDTQGHNNDGQAPQQPR